MDAFVGKVEVGYVLVRVNNAISKQFKPVTELPMDEVFLVRDLFKGYE